MQVLIDRQALIDAIVTWDKFGVDERCRMVRWHEGLEVYVHLRDVLTAISNLPDAQPERKKGQWSFIGGNMFECTCCGTPYTTQQLNGLRNYNTDPYAPKFCPNCGADMREPEDIPMEYFESGGR